VVVAAGFSSTTFGASAFGAGFSSGLAQATRPRARVPMAKTDVSFFMFISFFSV